MGIRGAELGIALNIRPVDVHIGQSLISLLCPSGGMVDTTDLKSVARKSVPVQARPRAPI